MRIRERLAPALAVCALLFALPLHAALTPPAISNSGSFSVAWDALTLGSPFQLYESVNGGPFVVYSVNSTAAGQVALTNRPAGT